MKVALITVGTSIISNLLREGINKNFEQFPSLKEKLLEISEINEKGFGKDNILLMKKIFDNIGNEKIEYKKIYKKLFKEAAFNWFEELKNTDKIRFFSAEYSTIKILAEKNIFDTNNPKQNHLVLFYSDTFNGEICGYILEKLIANTDLSYGFSTEIKKIDNLSYTPESFRIGLNFLVNSLVKSLQQYKKENNEIFLIATGGFKVESAYQTLTGLFFNIPVYYFNELFSDVIKIPPLPIRIDPEFWMKYRSHLLSIRGKSSTIEEIKEEFESEKIPEDFFMLLTNDPIESGKLILSPIGELALLRCENIYRQQKEKELDFKIKENPRTKFNWAGHTPFGTNIVKRIENYLTHLAESNYVNKIINIKGGGEGNPQNIKISRKTDIKTPNFLNLTVLLKNQSISFTLELKNILEEQIDGFIIYFRNFYEHQIK